MYRMEKNDKWGSKLDQLKTEIRHLAYGMRDDRFDGWTKEYYRNCLRQLRDQINKALEE
jgi:hypothetical protein